MKNIIYGILMTIISGLLVFALILESKSSVSHLPLIIIQFTLIIFLITVLFYRNSLDRIIASWHNSFSQGNTKLESVFVGIGIFLYCFVFILVPVFFGFQFSIKPITYTYQTFIYLLGPLLLSLAISVPLGISVYSGKKWINSDTPGKIFSKMPSSTILPSIIFSIILGIWMAFAFGPDPFVIIYGTIYVIGYIIGMIVVAFIFAAFLRNYRVSQRKLFWRWLLTIIALAPYVIGVIGMFS